MTVDETHGVETEAAPARSRGGKAEPERTCVLTREAAPRDALVRLALSPDGAVLPDVRARAPGRGAWIGVDRAALEQAIAKGKLRGALARAFKTDKIDIPANLPQQIEAALGRAALDRLGLEARSGTLVTGTDRIQDQARAGRLALLLHAEDAGADGTAKLDQAWRVGGGTGRGVAIPAGRTILSMALGRQNVVHIGLIDRSAAARVSQALGRWSRYIGRDVTLVPATLSPGPSVLNDDFLEGLGD